MAAAIQPLRGNLGPDNPYREYPIKQIEVLRGPIKVYRISYRHNHQTFVLDSTISLEQHILNRIQSASAARKHYEAALQKVPVKLHFVSKGYLGGWGVSRFHTDSNRIDVELGHREGEDELLGKVIFELGNCRQIDLFKRIVRSSYFSLDGKKYAKRIEELEFNTLRWCAEVGQMAIQEDGWKPSTNRHGVILLPGNEEMLAQMRKHQVDRYERMWEKCYRKKPWKYPIRFVWDFLKICGSKFMDCFARFCPFYLNRPRANNG